MSRKEPSQTELDEMNDFGEYVSWLLEHNPPEKHSPAKSNISEDAEALINLGYAVAAGDVTLKDLEAMEWFREPKTEVERHYKELFLKTIRDSSQKPT